MSRCLPFPPPEYVKNGLQGEALLKQLEKLLRERALSKKKKKERKRKRKHGCNGDEVRRKKCEDDKGKRIYDRRTNCRGGNDKKVRTLSVELGQHISVNGYSDKCKLGCTFGKEKSSTFQSQVMVMNTPRKRNSEYNNNQGLTRKCEFDSNENLEISKWTSAESDKLECKELTVNRVFLPLQMVQIDFEDEKWWLSKKNPSKSERTQAKHDSNATSINQGIQPYANYLADAGIFVLPYVVPF